MSTSRRRVGAIAGGRLGRGRAEVPGPPGSEPRLRIGEAAVRAGVSTRTLRYYQELGLLTPAGTTAGGARRYSEADVARVERIRHLRDLVGFDLGEVGTVLAAEDRLAAIRDEWFQGQTILRRRQLLEEAISINVELQRAAQAKMAALLTFRAELEDRAAAYHARLEELTGPLGAGEVTGRLGVGEVTGRLGAGEVTARPATPGLTGQSPAGAPSGPATVAREAELTTS